MSASSKKAVAFSKQVWRAKGRIKLGTYRHRWPWGAERFAPDRTSPVRSALSSKSSPTSSASHSKLQRRAVDDRPVIGFPEKPRNRRGARRSLVRRRLADADCRPACERKTAAIVCSRRRTETRTPIFSARRRSNPRAAHVRRSIMSYAAATRGAGRRIGARVRNQPAFIPRQPARDKKTLNLP